MSKNSNLDIEKLTWTYFCLFSRSFSQLFLSFRSFVTPLLASLWSFGVFILAKCCGSLNKFNTYFLRSLDFSLFFRKWTFYTFNSPWSSINPKVIFLICVGSESETSLSLKLLDGFSEGLFPWWSLNKARFFTLYGIVELTIQIIYKLKYFAEHFEVVTLIS